MTLFNSLYANNLWFKCPPPLLVVRKKKKKSALETSNTLNPIPATHTKPPFHYF